jgi:putative FmdB family regulatory protein
MPLYEYLCRDCNKPFEAFVTADRTPSCPACSGANLAKLLSRPGMVGAAAARSSGDACGMPAPMCGAQGGRCGCH